MNTLYIKNPYEIIYIYHTGISYIIYHIDEIDRKSVTPVKFEILLRCQYDRQYWNLCNVT